jgi:hypothetical protein
MPRCPAGDLRCIILFVYGTGIGMNYRLRVALIAATGGLGGLLAGCGSKTDVSLAGNTPAQYSHVYVTVQAVWFNKDSTAGPDDGGWDKFSLSTPSTVDLVAQNGGNVGNIASSLRIQVGSYSQLLLIPVDPTAPLASSAQNAGALYNFEADYVDSAGVTHQLPLELLNPDKGIGIPTSLKVPVGNLRGTGLIGTGTGTGTTNGALPFASSSSTTGNPFGTSTGTTGTTGPFTSSTGSTSTTPNNAFAAALDGTVNLVPFTFASSSTGILWSAHATAAYDLSIAGGISGQLSLTNITTSTSGLPDIRVSAETLSTDGSRWVVASSTSVLSDGSFLLYPLATTSSTIPLYYDVVIHGPDIATIIVKGVQVPRPSSSNGATSANIYTNNRTNTNNNTNFNNANNNTNANNNNNTNTNSNANVNAVSIGTLTPRASAPSGTPTSYDANISTAPGALLPAGAAVNFYQTIARQGEVPYVIESSPIDPFNQVLFNPQALSVGTVDSGTWSTNGTVTINSAAPAEGAGSYLVAASASGFSDGTLSSKVLVSQPKSGTAMVVVPALKLESGASAGSLAATVVAATPGKYDQGQLLLSHNGALVVSAPLDAVLSQGTGGIVTVPGIPAGTPDAVYYATVRAWKSTDPSSVQRQWYPQVIDLRSSTSGSIALTVN